MTRPDRAFSSKVLA